MQPARCAEPRATKQALLEFRETRRDNYSKDFWDLSGPLHWVYWISDDGYATMRFDENGKVQKWEWASAPRKPLLDSVRRWLHLN
jgi:hypothetical protein